MTMAVWLDEFGRPERGSFSLALPQGTAATSPDEGPPRPRLRRSLSGRAVRFQLVHSYATKARFERWWGVAGPGYFRAPDWTRDGVPLLAPDGTPVLTPDGLPLLAACWRTYFAAGEAPEYRPRSPGSVQWLLTISATMMP